MSDERAKRVPSASHQERSSEERAVTENRELSDAERLELFRATLHQNHLPKLPEIPGYHVCWLTTTNPNDSITQRIMLGYELVKASDVPGFQLTSIKSGDFEGYVGVNEMVAAKLPMRLYQMYMRESHEARPNEEEGRLNSALDAIREEAEKRGLKIKEGEAAEGAWN